jgi:hypothetical protein
LANEKTLLMPTLVSPVIAAGSLSADPQSVRTSETDHW